MADIDFKIPCWYKNGCNLAEDKCEKTCHRYLEMNYLINNCGMKDAYRYLKELIPQKTERSSYARLTEIKANIVEFVENGKNLYIASPYVQTGKTSWSLKILYKYFDEIWAGNGFKVRGYFIHVPELLSKLKSFEFKETDEYKAIDKALKKADLVIWDDITSNSLNQTEQNILNLYIDKRFMEDKANIFNGWSCLSQENRDIANQLYQSMCPQVGQKLATRLVTNCEVIQLNGSSRVK